MKILWYPLARQDLAEALTGKYKLQGIGLDAPLLKNCDSVLGISNLSRDEQRVAAVALVGSAKKELFSWVSTYAEAAFPLTQFCRVCSIEDWEELAPHLQQSQGVSTVSPLWSSLVLGEMLGQSEADVNVAAVPLARAPACYSFAVARTVLLYPYRETAVTMCLDRLAVAEREIRFGRRPISVKFLEKIWSVALSLPATLSDSSNLVETITQIVAAVDEKFAKLLTSNRALLSDSAEDRIVGFDVIADTLFDQRNADFNRRQGGAVALAAASLLAGRGTSHVQLLAPAAKVFPETLVWYGLLAGVLGPSSWDKAWLQQTKGIERALRQSFRPDDPVSADICWPEYEWLSQIYTSMEALISIPKNTPRSLAIELLPGVNCQFRLALPLVDTQVSGEKRVVVAEAKSQGATISANALAEALDLLEHAQQILLKGQNKGETRQNTLFDADPYVKPTRQTRKKPTNKPEKQTR